jgi:chaperonin GroEL (HSP60 family)
MPANPKNFNVDSVRVVKILGGSVQDTAVVKGMVFGREPEGELQATQLFFFQGGRWLRRLQMLIVCAIE